MKLKIGERIILLQMLNEKQKGLDLVGYKNASKIVEKVEIKGGGRKIYNNGVLDEAKSFEPNEEAKEVDFVLIANVITDSEGKLKEKSQFGWSEEKDKGKEVEFTLDERKMIVDIINEKKDNKELGMNSNSKFIVALAESFDLC